MNEKKVLSDTNN